MTLLKAESQHKELYSGRNSGNWQHQWPRFDIPDL